MSPSDAICAIRSAASSSGNGSSGFELPRLGGLKVTDALQHDDIQLLISHTHGRLRAARFVFLRLGSAGRGAGRKWLSDLAEEVRSEEHTSELQSLAYLV